MKTFETFKRTSSLTLAAIAGAFTLASAALALTFPPTFAPRQFNTQQTHYLRFTVNFNSCVLASGTCSVKVGAVPYNAFIVRAYQQIITPFNSGTSDTVALGTSSGGTQLVANTNSVHSAAGSAAPLTLVAPGITPTGNGTTPNGGDGGFDIWAVYAQAGTAPTAGQDVIVIEYIAPNDGACQPTPTSSGTPAQTAC
jgi:hypothetical protein